MDTLAVELIVEILSRLHPKEMARCRRVSTLFRDVVDGSAQLQYAIECHLAGVVDNPMRRDMSIGERLANLRRWREASTACQFNVTETEIAKGNVRFELRAFGSAYVQHHGRRFAIVQPASPLRGRSEKQWTLNIGFEPSDFAYDHNEKVLVVLTTIHGPGHTHLRVCFLSPITGQAHQGAFAPSFSITANTPMPDVPDMHGPCSVSLFSTLLLITLRAINFPRVWVLDWKTGRLLLHLAGPTPTWWQAVTHWQPTSIGFLDKNHILLSWLDPLESNVMVLDIRSENGPQRLWNDAVELSPLVLEAPVFSDDAIDNLNPQYGPGLIVMQPQYAVEDVASLEDIFLHLPDAAMLSTTHVVRVQVGATSNTLSYNTLIPTKAIRLLMEDRAGTDYPHMPWEEWASHARIVAAQRLSHVAFVPTSAGRCLVPAFLADSQDADQPAFFYDLATATPFNSSRPGEITDSAEFGGDPPSLWDEPVQVGQHAPFRKLATNIRIQRGDVYILGEDFVVVARSVENNLVKKWTYNLE